MQRLFSAFPDRGPGAGLLLLRGAVGAIVAIQGAFYVFEARPDATATITVGWLALLVGVMLVVGVLTPVAGLTAMLVGALGASTWLPLPPMDSFDGWMASVFFGVVSLAIALLGPGAFSLDAYLFGRREIVIPRQSHADRAL